MKPAPVMLAWDTVTLVPPRLINVIGKVRV